MLDGTFGRFSFCQPPIVRFRHAIARAFQRLINATAGTRDSI
jgi:hypothetical protein